MQVTHLPSPDFYHQIVNTSRAINKHTWEHLLNQKTTRIKWILTDYQIQTSKRANINFNHWGKVSAVLIVSCATRTNLIQNVYIKKSTTYQTIRAMRILPEEQIPSQ